MLTALFSLFYITGEFHRFLHRGRAIIVNKGEKVKFSREACYPALGGPLIGRTFFASCVQLSQV